MPRPAAPRAKVSPAPVDVLVFSSTAQLKWLSSKYPNNPPPGIMNPPTVNNRYDPTIYVYIYICIYIYIDIYSLTIDMAPLCMYIYVYIHRDREKGEALLYMGCSLLEFSIRGRGLQGSYPKQ